MNEIKRRTVMTKSKLEVENELLKETLGQISDACYNPRLSPNMAITRIAMLSRYVLKYKGYKKDNKDA